MGWRDGDGGGHSTLHRAGLTWMCSRARCRRLSVVGRVPVPAGTCCFSCSRQRRSWARLRPGRAALSRLGGHSPGPPLTPGTGHQPRSRSPRTLPVLLQRVVHRPAGERGGSVPAPSSRYRHRAPRAPFPFPPLTDRPPLPAGPGRGRARRSRARPPRVRSGPGCSSRCRWRSRCRAPGAPGTRPPAAAPGCCRPRAPCLGRGGTEGAGPSGRGRAPIGPAAPRGDDVGAPGRHVRAGKRRLQI